MKQKRVAFIANSLGSVYRFREVLDDIGADVAASSTAQMASLLASEPAFDLVIYEAVGPASAYLSDLGAIAERRGFALLAIADEETLANMSLPDKVAYDFVVAGAGHAECVARVVRLLGGTRLNAEENEVVVDDMIINLGTYQVTVAGEPVDLTYLEYALLAFFAQHPNRAFTRDALLQNVWGFDYFGGSRTVDVHVRRIRAKLGPGIARHLETVRGVGYLWNPQP